MGFDKYFHDDHCYIDDNVNYVAMNVEIIEETPEATVSSPHRHRAAVEKAHTGHSEDLFKQQFEYEAMAECDSVNNGTVYTECGQEHSELFLLEDEKLVKPGDKFESHDAFVQYVNENAKRWNFYYSCYDSRKPNTENESYIYNCVYLRNKEKYKKKGLRKRNNTLKTDCPCKIKLRRLPYEKELTVVFVCNHHDHELSAEQFCKLQHGRRLPPYIKEEILDFLTLRVNKSKIRNYVEMETGFRMSRPFFYTLERNMQKVGRKRTFTEERLKLLHEKIVAMDAVSQNDEDNIEKQTKSWDEVTSTSSTEQDQQSEVSHSETLQSVNNLQKLAKCEILNNPWIPDQCIAVIPSRTDIQKPDSEMQDQEFECLNENIEYDDNIQEINNYNSHNNEDESQNDIDNIAYETVVIEGDDQEIVEQIETYVGTDIFSDGIEIENREAVENVVDNIEQEAVEIQYENDDVINYTVNEETQHDVGIQANIDTGQTVLPVFDVYMKNGNVMGFVVNDNAINGLKEGVDEAIQTSEDIIYSDTQEIEDEGTEILDNSNGQTVDTYTKHEYIHRYNIEHYMSQPHFPNYVEMLAKETHMDVLNMFTNIYNEKAMFKLTTTQKGNEGNTRIQYITHNGKIRKKRKDNAKREKFGRNLQSIFILKEKMRILKKENEELMKRNEYLQDVALKLVNMR